MTGSWGDNEEEPDPDTRTIEGLLQLLNAQAAWLVSIGTDGPKTDFVNHRYVSQRRKFNAGLKARGLDPPFPYEDVWTWYSHYFQHIPGLATSHRACLGCQHRAITELDQQGLPRGPGSRWRHSECSTAQRIGRDGA